MGKMEVSGGIRKTGYFLGLHAARPPECSGLPNGKGGGGVGKHTGSSPAQRLYCPSVLDVPGRPHCTLRSAKPVRGRALPRSRLNATDWDNSRATAMESDAAQNCTWNTPSPEIVLISCVALIVPGPDPAKFFFFFTGAPRIQVTRPKSAGRQAPEPRQCAAPSAAPTACVQARHVPTPASTREGAAVRCR